MANQGFWQLAVTRQIVKNAIIVGVIVGTILALINYGDKVIKGNMQLLDWLKLCLTYFVPYAVSTYSAVKSVQAHTN